MMKTETGKKVIIKIASQEQQENAKNCRKTLKVLQQSGTDKENLVGRPFMDKDIKGSDLEKTDVKRKKVVHKSVQTATASVGADDLTSDKPSDDYWRLLAQQREAALNDSFQENERLKEKVESLEEENKLCKEMLDESKTLVEILQEMVNEQDQDTTEIAEEATE